MFFSELHLVSILFQICCEKIFSFFESLVLQEYTPSPWLTQIRLTRISLARIFKKFPFLT